MGTPQRAQAKTVHEMASKLAATTRFAQGWPSSFNRSGSSP